MLQKILYTLPSVISTEERQYYTRYILKLKKINLEKIVTQIQNWTFNTTQMIKFLLQSFVKLKIRTKEIIFSMGMAIIKTVCPHFPPHLPSSGKKGTSDRAFCPFCKNTLFVSLMQTKFPCQTPCCLLQISVIYKS